MVKVYLFRKLSALSPNQRDVYKEAVTGVLEQVLQGNASTIFNYGNWPNYTNHGDSHEPNDVVRQIIQQLFRHVAEFSVSIKHLQMNHTDGQFAKESDGKIPNVLNEHFVSSPDDVFIYMEKVMQTFLNNDQDKNCDSFAHVVFTLNVGQRKMAKTKNQKLLGKLQLVHLMSLDACAGSFLLKNDESSIREVLKIVRALANNPKTHLRYHNIRLTHLLNDLLLASTETIVIINYTEMPQFHMMLMGPLKSPSSSVVNSDPQGELWKEQYMKEHKKYMCLKEKVLNLDLWNRDLTKLEAKQLDELLEILEQQSSNGNSRSTSFNYGCMESTMNNDPGKRLELCALANNEKPKAPLQIRKEIEKIQLEIKHSADEMLELQEVVEQVGRHNRHNEEQLVQKDLMLDKLNDKLVKANDELRRQKMAFLQKLNEYSEKFSELWKEQCRAMKLQEKQHEQQLTEMFDSLCEELHNSHKMELLELCQQITKPAIEKEPTSQL
ncbi:kinesin heavy chain [Drosophila willistoni]|uniref:kinesin heavy chain n=1 Tax=Drosophila willistoni TaxID=7260 RepID=UPI000C26C956|nr:kinesin heavy chain [Drosophila willistoni]